MREIKYNSGGQPFYVEDSELQQDEIFKAIENQYANTNGCVLSGCVVTGNAISAGLVYLSGKIRELPNQTGLTFPCYIKASAVQEYDSRIHFEDNQNKTTKRAFNAEITNTMPVSGDFITVTATGCNKRLQYVLKNDQNGQFAPDAFTLNAGKVSYVKASRVTNQTLANGGNLISWTSEIDDRNEFDATNSEFTATEAGIYAVSCSVRVDTTSASGYALGVEIWNGSAWVAVAESLRNAFFSQGAITVSTCEKLAAGGRLRVVVLTFGTGFGPIQYAYLSIARVG